MIDVEIGKKNRHLLLTAAATTKQKHTAETLAKSARWQCLAGFIKENQREKAGLLQILDCQFRMKSSISSNVVVHSEIGVSHLN